MTQNGQDFAIVAGERDQLVGNHDDARGQRESVGAEDRARAELQAWLGNRVRHPSHMRELRAKRLLAQRGDGRRLEQVLVQTRERLLAERRLRRNRYPLGNVLRDNRKTAVDHQP